MSSRLQQARAALLRAERQWQGSAACVHGGRPALITRAFGDIDLTTYFSAGGLMPTGLHEIMTEHHDSAASALAWHIASLTADMKTGHGKTAPNQNNMAWAANSTNGTSPKPATILWVQQRKALDQGQVYAPALFAPSHMEASAARHTHHPDLVMMNIDQQQTALWTCEEAAKSGQVGNIILETTDYDLTTARRLQLACEAGSCRLIVLRHHRAGQKIAPSPAWSRWHITAHGIYRKLSLIGGRGVRPASWKVYIDEATLLVSVAAPLENGLPPQSQSTSRMRYPVHA